MKVFVTGATGFIGGNLIKEAINRSWEVTVLIRKTGQSSIFKGKNIKFVLGSVENPDCFKDKLNGIDLVINCAGALPYRKLSDREYFLTNVLGVENLLSICKKSGVKKVIHLSTTGVYTDRKDIYSKTKLEGEKIVKKYISAGLKTIIIRPTIGYGPGDTRPGFLDLFRLVSKGIFIPIGKGDNYFHTIYVGNLVEAILLAAKNSAADGQDFIIGDDPCPKMNDILGAIYRLFGKKKPRVYLPKSVALAAAVFFDLAARWGLPVPLNTKRVKFVTEETRFNIDKAKNLLGYSPKVSLDKGMKETFNWYKNKGYL